jgi:D-glycero-D-manno-heptose 1,7-bisphosphate phosphatase
MNRAIFFDRDGVINQSPGPGKYLLSPDEFILNPGAREMLTAVKAAGWRSVLITNQQCVAKQLLTEKDLAGIHAHMQALLGPEAAFDHLEACIHAKGTCACRKPLPGMVISAAKLLNINVSQSWLVGDNDTDILCGRDAGIGVNIRFLSEKTPQVPADYTFSNFADLLRFYLEQLNI